MEREGRNLCHEAKNEESEESARRGAHPQQTKKDKGTKRT